MSKKNIFISELNAKLKTATNNYKKCLVKNCNNTKQIKKYTKLFTKCNKKFKDDTDKSNECFTKGVVNGLLYKHSDINYNDIEKNAFGIAKCSYEKCDDLGDKKISIEEDLMYGKRSYGQNIVKIDHTLGDLKKEINKCYSDNCKPSEQLNKENQECDKFTRLIPVSIKNMKNREQKRIECRKKYNLDEKNESIRQCKQRKCNKIEKKIEILDDIESLYLYGSYRCKNPSHCPKEYFDKSKRHKEIRELKKTLKKI